MCTVELILLCEAYVGMTNAMTRYINIRCYQTINQSIAMVRFIIEWVTLDIASTKDIGLQLRVYIYIYSDGGVITHAYLYRHTTMHAFNQLPTYLEDSDSIPVS